MTWGIAAPSTRPTVDGVGVLVGGKMICGSVGRTAGVSWIWVAVGGRGVSVGVAVGQPPASAATFIGELITNPTRMTKMATGKIEGCFPAIMVLIENLASIIAVLSPATKQYNA